MCFDEPIATCGRLFFLSFRTTLWPFDRQKGGGYAENRYIVQVLCKKIAIT